jgi:uncharacterized protein YjiS (DUF1127 family)
LFAWFRAWLERRRQRRTLAALDERALRDIGLNRYDIGCGPARVRAMLIAEMRWPI